MAHTVNCDLPTVEDMVRDPQVFFRGCSKPVVVFDEVHQLRDPARVLKIGADGFPKLKILATGSSTLAASKKFRDTLTGRKRLVHLTPVLWDELPTFGVTLPQRLFHGGLPPALLAESKKPAFYREWLDSFFARDIQRLFGFRDMNRLLGVLPAMDDRVEPFFVCILGQRYGWVPAPHHFRDTADRQRQQREPRSITDFEVRHAVLQAQGQVQH